MTPIDEIREAARLMRERAEKATPGPWFVTDQAERYGGLVATPTDHCPEDREYGGHLIGESMSTANRNHVASMHPAVALSVAEWLDCVAIDDEREPESAPRIRERTAALSVARVYLDGAR